MNYNKFYKKRIAMLRRARLLSRCFALSAVLAVISAIVLPRLQKAAVKPAGEIVSDWEYFLLQLPWFDRHAIAYFYIGALVLIWMAYMLSALVSVAEAQFIGFDE